MTEEEFLITSRIFLTIGLVLIGLSLIIPWGEISVGILGNADFYMWGVELSSPIAGTSEFMSYTSLLSESSPFSQQASSYPFQIFLAIFVLPLSLLALIMGVVGEFGISKYGKSFSLRAGILSVLSVVFFYLFIQFGMLRAFEQLSALYDWSIGFYLMIIGTILFFITFSILAVTDKEST
jgi:hypothetical protein